MSPAELQHWHAEVADVEANINKVWPYDKEPRLAKYDILKLTALLHRLIDEAQDGPN